MCCTGLVREGAELGLSLKVSISNLINSILFVLFYWDRQNLSIPINRVSVSLTVV